MDDKRHEIEERLDILLAQGGDRAAVSRLVDRYDPRLMYFIRRILGDGDGTLDVLQSVWMTVYRRLAQLRSPDAFRVWLFRIAHDCAVTEWRRRSRQPLSLEHIPERSVPDDESAVFDNAELVHTAMISLSVDHRRVLSLHFVEEMTIDEIAQVLSCVPGTVKSRLHYARAALRRRIEELLDGPA